MQNELGATATGYVTGQDGNKLGATREPSAMAAARVSSFDAVRFGMARPEEHQATNRPMTVATSDLGALSIVIPSFNARALLRRTLRTLEVAAPEAEVIVVDGSSNDGSGDMVRAEFPWAKLLIQPNHGFAHAVNRGLEQCTRPYLLLLNSDLFVTRAALESMYSRLSADPLLAAAAPTLTNEDGSKQRIFGAFYWPNWVEVRKATRVWLLSAACLMTRRDVVDQLGALDESFFLYNEEYDWCARARRAGFHMEILPEPVVHVGGGSTGRNPFLTLEEQRGFLYLSSKHASPLFVQGLRRAMQFEGFCYSRIDPRPTHRQMWAKLESLSRREAYLESHFEVSGRGDSVARPQGLKLGEPVAAVEVTTESGAHAIPGANVTGARAEATPSNVRPIRREPHARRPNRAAM